MSDGLPLWAAGAGRGPSVWPSMRWPGLDHYRFKAGRTAANAMGAALENALLRT